MTDEKQEYRIETWLDLFNEISYAWNSSFPPYRDPDDGTFVFDKLYIGRDWAQYKTQNWKLGPGLYEKVEILYSLFKSNTEQYIEGIKDDH